MVARAKRWIFVVAVGVFAWHAILWSTGILSLARAYAATEVPVGAALPHALLLTGPFVVGGVLLYGLWRGVRPQPTRVAIRDGRLPLLDPEAFDR